MNNESFNDFVRTRKTCRRFTDEPVSDDLLTQLLECARWAPSCFNLQPAHYVIVTDKQIKEKLLPACFFQKVVEQAPALIIFTGDRQVVNHNLESVLQQEMTSGTLLQEGEEKLKRHIEFHFGTGVFSLHWLVTWLLSPIIRLFTPFPHMPLIHKRSWLNQQVMMSAMNFLLAAHASGLGSCSIESFDEWRIKYHLKIPRSHIISAVVAVGYPADYELAGSTRLALDEKLHWDRW